MKHNYTSLLLCLCFPLLLEAQTDILRERVSTPMSPSEKRYGALQQDMDVKQQKQLFANPAFYEIINRNKEILSVGEHTSILSAGYARGEMDGDFLPAEGNEFEDYRVTGSGVYATESAGTLFGTVQYARGKHRNIGWNATRYPELYQPYISTDSVGGDFKYEDYQVSGGYAFRLGNVYLGAHGAFQGEQAHRRSDPRALNNTTWLTLGAGAGWFIHDHLLMARGRYTRNKQHIRLRYWRPGQQDRFFVCYGFGLYDTRASGVFFGYSRMYYIDRGDLEISYLSPARKPFRLYADLSYTSSHMKTEESDIRDLYKSKTQRFYPSLRLDYTPSASLFFSLLAEHVTDKKKGFENIFEEHLVDEENNIYDFRLIDTQQQYLLTTAESRAELKATYAFARQSVSFRAGITHHLREEEYKSESFKVRNTAFAPYAGAAYRMKYRRSELDISALFTRRLRADDTYRVKTDHKSIELLDFQHAFTSYAYYNSNWSALTLSGTYLYHLPQCAIGINVKLMHKQGNRHSEAIYTGKIGFESSAPLVSTLPDKHNEVWGAASLFFVF